MVECSPAPNVLWKWGANNPLGKWCAQFRMLWCFACCHFVTPAACLHDGGCSLTPPQHHHHRRPCSPLPAHTALFYNLAWTQLESYQLNWAVTLIKLVNNSMCFGFYFRTLNFNVVVVIFNRLQGSVYKAHTSAHCSHLKSCQCFWCLILGLAHKLLLSLRDL